jgi:hypothetical protein
MAIARVALGTFGNSAGAGTAVVTAGAAVSVGDLLTLWVEWGAGANTISTVTDDLGNTWTTTRAKDAGVDQDQQWFQCTVTTGGTPTVIVTFSTSVNWRGLLLDKWTGWTVPAGVLDTSNYARTATTTTPSVSVTTTTASLLLCVVTGHGGVHTPGTGFTAGGDDTIGGTMEWLEQSSAGARTCDWSCDSSNGWDISAVAFRVAPLQSALATMKGEIPWALATDAAYW